MIDSSFSLSLSISLFHRKNHEFFSSLPSLEISFLRLHKILSFDTMIMVSKEGRKKEGVEEKRKRKQTRFSIIEYLIVTRKYIIITLLSSSFFVSFLFTFSSGKKINLLQPNFLIFFQHGFCLFDIRELFRIIEKRLKKITFCGQTESSTDFLLSSWGS